MKKILSDSRGVAMVTAIMILLFLVPLVLSFVARSHLLTRFSTRERLTKASRAIAMNAVLDYMRQFSQTPYDDHLSTTSLQRTQVLYQSGFTNVSVSTDVNTRSIYVSAVGRHNGAMQQVKTLDAVIKFVSDITQFGTTIPTAVSWGGTAFTYNGGLWLRTPGGAGTISLDAAVTVRGDAVINGTLDRAAGGSLSILSGGNLYMRNITPAALANTTFTGGGQMFLGAATMPQLSTPTLSPAYFQARANWVGTLPFYHLTFNPAGTVDIRSAPPPAAVLFNRPTNLPGGMVLLAPNARVFVRGQVLGHVTLVCTASTPNSINGSTNQGFDADVGITGGGTSVIQNPNIISALGGGYVAEGVVKIEGSLTYATTTPLAADVTSSLAILADNSIIIETNTPGLPAANPNLPTATNSPGTPTYEVGLLYVSNEPQSFGNSLIRRLKGVQVNGTASGLQVFGVRGTAQASSNGAWAGGTTTTLDQNLQNFPPPGLPESPLLSSLDYN